MTPGKIVQEVFGKDLEAAGYTYVRAHSTVWAYEKKVGDAKLMIAVMRDCYFKGNVKMEFMSTAYGQRDRELSDFVPGVEEEFWPYNTEEEFRAVMVQFREWTLKYGLELMEKMSIPTTEERPKPETNRYLYENHEELNRKYLELLGLAEADTGKILCVLEKKVKELREKDMPFNEVEEELIGMAAVFGHSLCLNGIGEWIWDKEYQMCKIKELGGTFVGVVPLHDMIAVYRHKNGDYFIVKYAGILRSWNTCIRAGNLKGEMVDVEKVIKKIREENS